MSYRKVVPITSDEEDAELPGRRPDHINGFSLEGLESGSAEEEFIPIDNSVSLQKLRPMFPCNGVKFICIQRFKEYLISQQWQAYTIYDICTKIIQPWTERDQCSFVDLMKLRYSRLAHPILQLNYNDAFDDKATMYIIHNWESTFVELTETLETDSEVKSSNLWLDIFIINQHSNLFDMKNWFLDILKLSMVEIGFVRLVFSNWGKGRKRNCLSRRWCLYELLITDLHQLSFDVLFHPQEKIIFDSYILENIDSLIHIFTHVDVQRSSCTSNQESELLLHYFECNESVLHSNTSLSKFLKKWLVGYGIKIIHAALPNDDNDLKFYHGDRQKLLTTMNRFAYMLGEQLKYEEAEKMYQRVLSCYQIILGAEHPNTLGVVNNLAYLYHAQNKLKEAEQMAILAANGYQQLHGELHQNTMNAYLHAGEITKKLLDFKRSEAFYRIGLRICSNILGKEHPKTLVTSTQLGDVLVEVNRLREALSLYTHALDGYIHLYGEAHVSTGDTALSIAAIYEKRRNWDRAADMYDLAYCSYDGALGPDHEKTALAKKNLIAASLRAEQYAHLKVCSLS